MPDRSGKTPFDDAHDVLAGRRAARMEDLFDLIHAVNPSGRDLPKAQSAAAYTVKARLQSLVIERFGEALAIEEVAGSAGNLVGLRHRTYDKDACHAVLGELSGRAQAWVRLQRDLRAESAGEPAPPTTAPRGAPPAPEPEAGTGPAALLAQGEAALAEYDFDAARTRFAAALAAPVSHPEAHLRLRAARALLDVLVDHLADDAAALALRETLPPEVAQDEPVRCLLALAAAREGDRRLAVGLAAGLDGDRVPEVFLELAKGALAARETEECEQHLARIPAGSQPAAAARSVAQDLRRARAATARPLEERLAAEIRRGEAGDVERLAREVLAMHPGSEVAHRALATLRQQQEDRTAVELSASFEKAIEQSDPSTARAALSRLEVLRGPRPDLHARLAVARLAEVRAHERAAIDELVVALQGEVTSRAVGAYWAASDAVRDAVRARVEGPELGWLDVLGPVRASAGCAAAAAAAAAAPHVERELAAGRVESAVELIRSHAELLRSCARGRELQERVQAAAADHRRRVASERLAAAAAAAPPQALQILTAIASAHLDEVDRARAAALEDRLRAPERAARAHRRRLQILRGLAMAIAAAAGLFVVVRSCTRSAEPDLRSADEIALDAALQRDDLTAARAAAARLAERGASESERAAWSARRDELNAELRAKCIEDEGSGPSVGREAVDLWPPTDANPPGIWVARDGESVVRADQVGPRVLLRRFHRDGARARSAILRLPDGFRATGLHVDERTVALVCTSHVVRLDLESFDILEGLHFGPAVIEGVTTGARFVPGRRKLWVDWVRPRSLGPLHVDGQTVAGGTTIVDLADTEPGRTISAYRALVPVWGLPDPAVVVSHSLADVSLFDDAGRSRWDEDGEYVFHTAVAHPGGSNLLLLVSRPRPMAKGSGFMLTALTRTAGGQRGPEVELAWLPRGRVAAAATALSERFTYVLAEVGQDEHVLLGLRAAGDGVAEAWRQRVGEHVLLAHDAASQHVLAFRNDGERAAWTKLSGSPPAELAPTAPPPEHPPGLDPYRACAWTEGELRHRTLAYGAMLPLVANAPARARGIVEGALDATSGVALWFAGPGEVRARTLERLRELHGADPAVRVLAAEQLVHEARHADALASLAGLDAAALPSAMARHAAHLRAICLLVGGQEGEAGVELRRVASLGVADDCAIEPLAAWIDALVAPLDEVLAGARGATRRSLVGRLRAADRALASGDAEAARAWLDHPAAWARLEPQVLARLAEAFLRLPNDEPDLRVRKRWVLACFRGALAIRTPLSFGSADQTAAQLAALDERARQWLGDPSTSAAPLPTEPGPHRPGEAAGGDATFITTEVPPGMRPLTGALLRDSDAEQALLRHEADLSAEARDILARNRRQRVVGVVFDPALPAAEHYRIAREQLRGTRGRGPEAAAVVTLSETFRLLADWPHLLDQFQTFNNTAIVEGGLSLLLLRPGGAAWRRAR